MADTTLVNARPQTTIAARAAATVAWALWLIAVLAGALGLAYGIQEQATGHSVIPQSGLSYAAGTAVAVAFVSIGLLLRIRRPDIVIGWLFLGIGLVGGLANLSWAYVLLGAASGTQPGPLSSTDVAWIANTLQAPAWLTLALALVLLFPDGRFISRAWRSVLIAVLLTAAVLLVGLALTPGPLWFFPFITNPYPAPGLLGDLALVATAVALLIMIILTIAAAWSIRLRYRRATLVERQQLKWFGWAATLAISAGIIEIVVAGSWFPVTPEAADLSWLVFAAVAVTLPAAAFVAIQRYRLYDIDRLIGRTFVYGSLTAILAGLYAASIRLFTSLFVAFTGQSSDGALVLSTLVLATTFTPIKQRLESVARDHFNDPGPGRVAAIPATAETPTAPLPPNVADLDRRMEEIARRVSREVLAAEMSKPGTEVEAGAGDEPAS